MLLVSKIRISCMIKNGFNVRRRAYADSWLCLRLNLDHLLHILYIWWRRNLVIRLKITAAGRAKRGWVYINDILFWVLNLHLGLLICGQLPYDLEVPQASYYLDHVHLFFYLLFTSLVKSFHRAHWSQATTPSSLNRH